MIFIAPPAFSFLSHSQGLFLATGSLQASTPYLGGVLLAVITTWLFAADSLSKKVQQQESRGDSFFSALFFLRTVLSVAYEGCSPLACAHPPPLELPRSRGASLCAMCCMRGALVLTRLPLRQLLRTLWCARTALHARLCSNTYTDATPLRATCGVL